MQVIEQLKTMDDGRFATIYESLVHQGFGPLDSEVAKSLKFRPQAIRKLPLAKRAKRAKSILENGANAEMCYEIFGSYLIKEHKELVTGFLDLTGVKHEDGMIESTEQDKPDGSKVAEAATELDGKHAPEDVTLYLSLCAEQWPQVSEIQELWQARNA
jgi:hypothetical protein